MAKKFLSCLFAIILFSSFFSGAFSEDTIEALLNGEKFADESFDHYSIAETTVPVSGKSFSGNKKSGTAARFMYGGNKIDNGDSGVVVYCMGIGEESKVDETVMSIDEINQHNTFYYSSQYNGFRIDGTAASKKVVDRYCEDVYAEISSNYPEAKDFVLVTYSAGGYTANTMYRTIASNGGEVIGVVNMDNDPNKAFLKFTDIENAKATSQDGKPYIFQACSTDSRRISTASRDYLKKNESLFDKAVIYEGVSHGALPLNPLFKNDLINFINDCFTKTQDKSEDKENENTGKTTDDNLKATQTALLNKLNNGVKKVTTVASSVLSGASNLLSRLSSKLTNAVTAGKTETKTSASNNNKPALSTDSSKDSYWGKATTKIAAASNALSNSLKKISLAI